jgi:hypothetical protein
VAAVALGEILGVVSVRSTFAEQAAPWQVSDADLELVLGLGLAIFPVHGSVDDGNGGWRCTCGNRDCEHPAKHPFCLHGFKDAVHTVCDYRRLCLSHDNLNVGAATGEIVVIDGDVKHGGDVTLWALVRELEIADAVDSTVQAISGSGGPHLYFRASAGIVIPSSVSKLALGIDVRAAGGYIIAPPSRRICGGVYAWDAAHHPSDTKIAPLPPTLLERIVAALGQKNSNGTGRSGFKSKAEIHEGERNDQLHGLGRSLRAQGLAPDAIRAAVRAENKAKCRPPLEESEVEEIITNALRQPDRDDFKQTLRRSWGSPASRRCATSSSG